jgi:acetolactate synthase-1/2/3 large subunit
VLPIYDEIFQQNDIRHVLVRHEQGAVHMAEGYARSTGKVGVALVTSGPGATNAVTGLTDALMDSIPIVVLTGQVPTFMIGTDGFQEADTVGITRPCTKMNWLVKDTAKLADTIHQAFHVATHGRPGPVLIDIPKDVQFATGDYTPPKRPSQPLPAPHRRATSTRSPAGRADGNRRTPDLLYRRRRDQLGPRASQLLRELWPRRPDFPVTSTLMGLGAYPASGKNWLGMLGMHGTLRGQPGDARLRRDDQHRRALR